MSSHTSSSLRWYDGVTRYQWLVLAIASAGWMFNAFEGQIFNITRQEMLPEILGLTADSAVLKYGGNAFSEFF